MDELEQFLYEEWKNELWNRWINDQPISVDPMDATEKYFLKIRNSEPQNLNQPERDEKEHIETFERGVRKLVEDGIFSDESIRLSKENFKMYNTILEEYRRDKESNELRMTPENYQNLLRDMGNKDMEALKELLEKIKKRKYFGSLDSLEMSEAVKSLVSARNYTNEADIAAVSAKPRKGVSPGGLV